MEKGQEPFSEKLKYEVLYIQKHLLPRLDGDQKEEFAKLEKLYQGIAMNIEKKLIAEEDAFSVYGQFLKTLKQAKRKFESKLRFMERGQFLSFLKNYYTIIQVFYPQIQNVDAFLKKWEALEMPMIPVIHDIKMNVTERMGKFDINKLKEQNFQMHLYSNKELCDIAFQMIDHHGYNNSIGIPPTQLQGLINKMCLTYNTVPYVESRIYYQIFPIIEKMKVEVKDFVTDHDFFASLLSGLAHDMNHKGVNNLYKQKKNSEINKRYCEVALLENMHVSQYFRILYQYPDLDITKKFTDPVVLASFKKLTISNILATDMGKHNKFVAKLKKRGDATIALRENPDHQDSLIKYHALKSDNPDDRSLIMNILVHASDIGNPCLKFENYMNWSYLVCQEFFDQTEKEAKKGLEVTGFLKYKDKLTFFNGQGFFSKMLVLPLWKEIGRIFTNLQQYPDQIESNLKRIDEEKAKLQASQ